ncbi:MAG: DUF3891 family protein [Verrucomicrobiota bacterium]
MIRIDTGDSWLLVSHKEHARLAGEFARRWKNEQFEPPKPFAHILDAVTRHDDSWEKADAAPSLTHEMQPSAFTKELVGTYDAFEEIDLPNYLRIRGEATEAAAKRDPYSAILISMHTVNLLTVQANLSMLTADERAIHSAFIARQIDRQSELKKQILLQPDLAPYGSDESLKSGFKFLQACDSFSLYASVGYDDIGKLQHTHVMRDGHETEITIAPKGNACYKLEPYPLDEPEIEFETFFKRVPKSATSSLESFRAAYCDSKFETVAVTVTDS